MKLYISPCPNDTFTFHAMIHGLVDTEGLEFDVTFEDIDQLNQRARCNEVDLIKVSYAALPELLPHYRLLRSGGAMGFGNAPIIVGREGEHIDLKNACIAIPGQQTTAALLLKRLIKPNPEKLRVYLFSDIAEAVAGREVDAGVLIHEGRFTYRQRGLELIADLGEIWDRQYGVPVPLGAILVNRDHGAEQAQRVERVVRRSVEYAMANPDASAEFVRCHAAELDPQVRSKHISYFVNRFSTDFGHEGELAIRTLLEIDPLAGE